MYACTWKVHDFCERQYGALKKCINYTFPEIALS